MASIMVLPRPTVGEPGREVSSITNCPSSLLTLNVAMSYPVWVRRAEVPCPAHVRASLVSEVALLVTLVNDLLRRPNRRSHSYYTCQHCDQHCNPVAYGHRSPNLVGAGFESGPALAVDECLTIWR